MGSYNSRRMIDDDSLSNTGSEDDSDQEIDYAAILQSLISRYTKYGIVCFCFDLEVLMACRKYLDFDLLQWANAHTSTGI